MFTGVRHITGDSDNLKLGFEGFCRPVSEVERS